MEYPDLLDVLEEECRHLWRDLDRLADALNADPAHPDLGWDGVDLIEKGTGRRALTLQDRDELGELADRFPLLG